MSEMSLGERMEKQGNFIVSADGREDEAPAMTSRWGANDFVLVREDGGPGSGNFGHEGRPGEVGGSAPSDESKAKDGFSKKEQKIIDGMKFKGGSSSVYKDLESAAEVKDGKKNYHEARFKDGRVIQSHSFSSMKEVLKDLKKNADDDGKMGDATVWIKYRNGAEVSYKAGDDIMDLKTSDIASALVKQGKTQYGFNTEYDPSEPAPKSEEKKNDTPARTAESDYKQYGETFQDRKKTRQKMYSDLTKQLNAGRTDLQMYGQERYTLRTQRNKLQTELDGIQLPEGITLENCKEKTAEAKAEYEKAHQAFLAAVDADAPDMIELGQKRAAAHQRYGELLNFEYLKQSKDDIQGQLDDVDKKLKDAEQKYDAARSKAQDAVDSYYEDVKRMNAAILARYPTYDSIKTAEDAAEYATAKGYFKKWSPKTHSYAYVDNEPAASGAECVHMEDMDPDVARQACETLDKIYEKYPEMAGFVEFFGTAKTYSKNYIGEFWGRSVKMNPHHYGRKYEEDWGGGSFHPPIVAGEGVLKEHNSSVAHEFGHALDHFLCGKYPDMVQNVWYSSGKTDTIATKLLSQAAHNLGMTQTALKQKISGYACKNTIEAFAEAFSELICSDEPRPFILEIGRQIDSLYSTGKLAKKVKP